MVIDVVKKDDPVLARLLEYHLPGVKARAFTSYEEYGKERPGDLLVSGWLFQHGDAYFDLQRIHARHPQLPIVIYTSLVDEASDFPVISAAGMKELVEFIKAQRSSGSVPTESSH